MLFYRFSYDPNNAAEHRWVYSPSLKIAKVYVRALMRNRITARNATLEEIDIVVNKSAALRMLNEAQPTETPRRRWRVTYHGNLVLVSEVPRVRPSPQVTMEIGQVDRLRIIPPPAMVSLDEYALSPQASITVMADNVNREYIREWAFDPADEAEQVTNAIPEHQ